MLALVHFYTKPTKQTGKPTVKTPHTLTELRVIVMQITFNANISPGPIFVCVIFLSRLAAG